MAASETTEKSRLPRSRDLSLTARIPVNRVQLQLEALSVEIPAQIVMHGGGCYVRVPKEVVEYYDLQPGDVLRIRIAEVRRARYRAAEEEGEGSASAE